MNVLICLYLKHIVFLYCMCVLYNLSVCIFYFVSQCMFYFFNLILNIFYVFIFLLIDYCYEISLIDNRFYALVNFLFNKNCLNFLLNLCCIIILFISRSMIYFKTVIFNSSFMNEKFYFFSGMFLKYWVLSCICLLVVVVFKFNVLFLLSS